MGQHNILAIIPARGGSKGLPGKNLLDLGGKPLIAWTIEAVQHCSYDLDMCFSTEDEEIARVARDYGAYIPFMRPKELARDHTSSLAVLLHSLFEMEAIRGRRYDYVLYLQPTSPFRGSALIDKGISTIISSDGIVSVGGVSLAGDAHPYWCLYPDERGFLNYYVDLDGPRPMRRQELPPAYHFNGSMYITRRSYYDTARDPFPVFGFPFIGVPMDSFESINIDTQADLDLARAMLYIRSEAMKP